MLEAQGQHGLGGLLPRRAILRLQEPPSTTRMARRLWAMARVTAMGSMPGWWRKRRSSAAMVALAIFSGTVAAVSHSPRVPLAASGS
jgi:hypothetical protein